MDKPCWGFPPIHKCKKTVNLGVSIFKKNNSNSTAASIPTSIPNSTHTSVPTN